MTDRVRIRWRRLRAALAPPAALLLLSGAVPQSSPGPAAAPEPAVARPVDLACAPRAAWKAPRDPIRLVGSQEGQAKRMYGPGDAIVVAGGLDRGLVVGQEYFARRQSRPLVNATAARRRLPFLLHTAGWVRIVAVEETMAVAVVSHACDGLLEDDYLEPFALPAVPTAAPAGRADYGDPVGILFGEDGGTIAGVHRFMVIGRGRDDGVVPGQRFTVFRDTVGTTGPVTNLGEAIAVLVDSTTATVRLFKTRDAVYAGDQLAPHR